jgi:hypothetical protein
MMIALATAFTSVWITVALYVGWLDSNQRRLAARANQLSALLAQARDVNAVMRKAA